MTGYCWITVLKRQAEPSAQHAIRLVLYFFLCLPLDITKRSLHRASPVATCTVETVRGIPVFNVKEITRPALEGLGRFEEIP